jgi:hypothetical protein
MAIDKIVPKYLNKEDDVRLVKNVEMTDALNVRISADMTGDGGVIKNSYGNEAVSFASGVNWQDKTHALPSGTNKVVGSVADLKDGIVIFFVWNSNSDHSIYRFSTASDVAELVYRDSVLEFQADSFVKGDVIRNLSQDALLYFTDGISSPKKINVSRAIRGGYSSVLNTGLDSEKLEFLTLAKKPPLDPPTFTFFTDSSVEENNIYENTYQFAYRYVYLDGEVSAISKYSELAVSQQQLRDGLITDAQKLENNAIRVSVLTSVADVRRIEVLARNGNTGAWFIIGEISNPSLSSAATLYTDFKNDQLYRFISTTDSDKLYDAVPLTAQSQTISGSRLILGNYTEGYANQKNDISLWPNYDIRVDAEEIAATPLAEDMDVNKYVQLDTSLLSLPTTRESILTVDFGINFGDFSLNLQDYFIKFVELDDDLNKINNGATIFDDIVLNSSPLSVYKTVIIPTGSDITDIVSLINSTIVDSYPIIFDSDVLDTKYATRFSDYAYSIAGPKKAFFSGSGLVSIQQGFLSGSNIIFPIVVSSASLTIKQLIYGNNTNAVVNIFSSDVASYLGDNQTFTAYPNGVSISNPSDPESTWDIVGNTPTTTNTHRSDVEGAEVLYSTSFLSEDIDGHKQFKSGASHDFGVVFYDDRNRSSSVQEAGKVFIDWFGNRNYKGSSSVVMRIASGGPTWATRWSPVYIKRGSIDKFLQYTTVDAFYMSNSSYIKSNPNTANKDVIYLSMRSLEGKEDSYKESRGANLEYSFSNGDRVRVVSYQDTVYKFTVSSLAGGAVTGDAFLQFGIPTSKIFVITEVDLAGGTGYIYATGSSDPTASGAIFNPINGSVINYSSFTKVSKKTYQEDISFEVVDYLYFDDNASTNPILNTTSEDTTYNTTGWFLVLKDKDVSGFSKSAVVAGTDKWSNKCIIEIYNKRRQAQEEVYYEIGRSYDVNSNGVLAGDRTSVSPIGAYCNQDRPLQFFSTVILYAGDVISDGAGNICIVNNVYDGNNTVSGTDYYYVVDATLQSGTFSNGDTFVVGVNPLNLTNSSDAVVQLNEGDSYLRLRQLRYGQDAKTFNYLVDYVESDSVSDFFVSNNTSIGRPFTVLPDAKTVYRTGSVTYSDPFLIDVQTNGLSSFNPTLANFYDLNYIHGSVRYLHNRDDSVVFLQDKKCGLFPVNRNLVQYSDGGQNLTVSTDVVGTPQYYQGEFGVNDNPESVAIEDGRIYFADIRSGKVIRISRDGITPISEQGMDAYFKDQFADIVSTASVKRVIGGIDDEAGEYIVSGPPVYTSTITITADGSDITTAYQLRVTDDGGTYEAGACFDAAIEELLGDAYATYTLQVAPDGSVIYGGIEYNDEVVFKVDTEYRNFNKICDTFDNSLNAVIFLDRLADGQPIYIGEEYIGTTPTTLYGIATNSTYDFFVMVTIDVARGTFVFDNSCGDYDGSIGAASETLSGFTTAYNTDSSVWNTRYSYNPENITCIDDVLYTFKNGTMYKHHDGVNRATYYGSADGSVVEVVAAFNPSMVKSYEAISLEGTAAWDTTITNTDQSSSIADTDYEQRERNWYAYIPRDSSANTGTTTITSLSGSSEIFALGAVSSVSGSDIVFTSDISYITFPVGADLYKVSGSTLVSITNTIASVSNGTTITCASAVAGVSAADEIVAIANGAIEGDQMRDYYAQIRLTNDSTSEVELYAVNAVFAKSNLANQLGQ